MKEKERIISYIEKEIDRKTVELHITRSNIETWQERLKVDLHKESVLAQDIQELKSLKVYGEDDDSY